MLPNDQIHFVYYNLAEKTHSGKIYRKSINEYGAKECLSKDQRPHRR